MYIMDRGIGRLLIVVTYILAIANSSFSFSTLDVNLPQKRSVRDHRKEKFFLPTLSSNYFLAKSFHTPMRRSSATSLTAASPKIISSLHTNNNFVLSILAILAASGIAMEKNTTIGKAISVSLLRSKYCS